MKIKGFWIVLLCCALFFTGCQSETPETPAGMTAVENEGADFNLYLPQDWTLGLNEKVVTATAPQDYSNISVMGITMEGSYDDIKTYWSEEYVKELLKTVDVPETGDAIVYEVEGENTTLDERTAARYVYTASISGTKYQFMQVLCGMKPAIGSRGTAYIFTYTALPENYESHLEEVDQILENFSFK